MGRRKKIIDTTLKPQEVAQAVKDGIDELLQAELSRISGLDDVSRICMEKNLRDYYKAIRKAENERA